MNEERTGKCLRQVEHIRGHMWPRYSLTVNQVVVATVKLSKWWLQLNEDFWRTISSVASLLAANLYQGNPDRNHKLWNIIPTERDILYMQVLLGCCYIRDQWKVGKIEIIPFVVVSFLTVPHCQFRGVGQGMKQTILYLWYPLFQAQWDRCDQRNHQT